MIYRVTCGGRSISWDLHNGFLTETALGEWRVDWDTEALADGFPWNLVGDVLAKAQRRPRFDLE